MAANEKPVSTDIRLKALDEVDKKRQMKDTDC